MQESVFFDGVRGLFASIDRTIYNLISVFYDTISSLTTKTILSSSDINAITNKIYACIAIFMIFKISFSLINYIVNPDLITDKVKGGGPLIRNILITFILVIFVPFGFDFLYRAQSAIIEDGIIEKLFNATGEEGTSGTRSVIMDDEYCKDNPAIVSYDSSTGKGLGDYISLIAFKTFFQIDDQAREEDINEALDAGYCRASVVDGKSASVNNILRINTIYNAPHANSTNHIYAVDYSFFISTIVGVVLALVFLSFCFDVAMRTIKLQFLEILAPIPIISYIDPDKSKNGMFSKWLKEVFSTWLSLFMRLLALNLAIYFMSFINESDIFQENLWMTLLIIIGILMFAKQLPKLLENILGIKASGSFNLNPLKKLDDEALGFKQTRKLAAGAVSGTAAAGMSAIGSIYSRNKAKEKFNDDNEKINSNFQAKKRQLVTDMYNNKISATDFNKQMGQLLTDSVQQKKAVKKEYNDKFSNRHPIASGLLAAGRAGNEAFKADHQSIQAIIENASKAATNAAKERTYRDNYGIGDRAMNQITDWGDVKKSGTADVVDRRVKELNDQLTQVTNALDSLRQEQSSFAPGTFMWETSGPNAGMISVSPTANPNDIIRARENVRMQQELQQTMKDLNSAIKSQTKILEQSKK